MGVPERLYGIPQHRSFIIQLKPEVWRRLNPYLVNRPIEASRFRCGQLAECHATRNKMLTANGVSRVDEIATHVYYSCIHSCYGVAPGAVQSQHETTAGKHKQFVLQHGTDSHANGRSFPGRKSERYMQIALVLCCCTGRYFSLLSPSCIDCTVCILAA